MKSTHKHTALIQSSGGERAKLHSRRLHSLGEKAAQKPIARAGLNTAPDPDKIAGHYDFAGFQEIGFLTEVDRNGQWDGNALFKHTDSLTVWAPLTGGLGGPC